ncbi:D-isomer specific 2-hydroxyacid dehydrogenase family protein [Gordonia neofelifaecis]|uniref:D-isomer specific 2-hydroxyacid dehydrogenase NAD-binding protein n=1 Tax=Gordonia neofelifaecis NRRL B-59395 TaxID=644548 RepID=F1YP87_9ACTN|nr:D-isomer specific 2-hydroxyacid dehydrogenase family protein [Gordonia neofelifaecis]EGD53482.1 D-isomer specific 2-hydroxyacid dehydrogenase NAD-binding protein [Gordonia neofelifaecis NRRL B-59395]
MKIAIEPVRDRYLVEAVTAAGSEVVALDDAEALVWIGGPDGFPELGDDVRWVALSTAGIERFVDADVLDDRRLWTNASGFYAAGVAEHALALLLAGLRQINTAVREHWAKELIDPAVRTLRGSTVAIIGAGGIGRELAPLLKACGATVIAVNRSGREIPGADLTLAATRLDEVWERTDHVVLAAPDTPETRHLIDDETLARLHPHTWIVNIARGPLIDQAALCRALADGVIAGAALDVTDPEPPADDDPLWSLPNVIITPHVANPASGLTREMAPFLAENVRRHEAGEELLAVVTPGAGY